MNSTFEPLDAVPGEPFDGEVTVRRMRFSNPESGFAVLESEIDQEDVILVGALAHLEERERVHVLGTWVQDKRFGMQVKVAQARPLAPRGERALLAYLERVKHVGRKRALKLIERHGEHVLEVIDEDPSRGLRAAGLSLRQAGEAARSWHALRSTRQLHLLLGPHGLSWLVPRLVKQYGDRAHATVRAQPYALTEVFGVGFAIADRIAHASGIEADDPARARAGIVHALAEAERGGSTCLPLEELAAATFKLLGGTPERDLLDEMISDGVLELEEERWVYRRQTAALEYELAERVRQLAMWPPSKRLQVPQSPPDEDLVPEPEQWSGVQAAFGHRLSILTGGPGTGKTASIKLICSIAAEQKADLLLVAPTGRAARRMTEATGIEARTVHSALGWVPGEGPTYDDQHTLSGDVLVVDETSMANLELLVTLLRAVGPHMHVVLVGDADQLAPVGAGKPFAELVAAEAVPVARLEHIFRQAAGSMIVRGAHAVRHGEMPEFTPGEGMRRDLFLVERDDPKAALDEIVSLISERLPAHYGIDPVEDAQVFAPVYRGPLGIDALNERLRAALNPAGEAIFGGRLRIGDKLMLSGRNLHELGLMNGTVLRLLEYREADEVLVVSADGMIVELPEEEAPRLQLAYACSVHKGQGIELPVAVVVAHPASGAFFLRREMLYTAMTRARQATVIVGKSEVIARAARSPDTARRHGRLAERLGARSSAVVEPE